MGREINSKDLADKHGMLSHDEIDLLQYCVEFLSWGGFTSKDKWVSWYDKEYRMSEVATKSKPVIVVNIGANIGTSSCAMLEANPEAFIFSIDREPYPEERENIIACGLNPKRVIRLLGDSAEIGMHFPYQPDLVFVDGGHHDEAVMGDIEAWQPKCKSIMMFHDYAHPIYVKKPHVNIDRIVDEMMKDWERIGEARYLVGFRRKGQSET